MTVSYQQLARVWRDRQPANRANSGVEVYGWKNALRNAECERPGAIAVDVDGNLFIAEGGNDQDGAICCVVKTDEYAGFNDKLTIFSLIDAERRGPVSRR